VFTQLQLLLQLLLLLPLLLLLLLLLQLLLPLQLLLQPPPPLFFNATTIDLLSTRSTLEPS